MTPELPPRAGTRACFALVWTGVFYGLVLAAVVGLAWIAYGGITGALTIQLKWVGLAIVAIGLVLVACLPRRARLRPPGPTLLLAEQPALAAMLETVARETGMPIPASVVWCAEAKVDLATEGGFLGLCGRGVLTLGFPLVTGLDADALKAVLAREFGRFSASDGAWSARVYRMRAVMRRASTSSDAASPPPLFVRLLHVPFAVFAQFFLEISVPVARRQQALAEASAVRIAGAEALARALVEMKRFEFAWVEYLESAVEPVLLAKRRPPLAVGWRTYLASPEVRAALARREERSKRRNAGMPDEPAPVVSATPSPLPGVEIANLDALELVLLDSIAGPKSVRAHLPITWEQLVAELLEPQWRDALTRYGAGIRGMVVESLPTRAEDLTELGRKLNPRDAKDPAGAQKRATTVLTAALAVALRRRDFTLDAQPGTTVRARRGGESVDVEETVKGMAAGRITPAEWANRCRALGISGLDLGAEAAAYLG